MGQVYNFFGFSIADLPAEYTEIQRILCGKNHTVF